MNEDSYYKYNKNIKLKTFSIQIAPEPNNCKKLNLKQNFTTYPF